MTAGRIDWANLRKAAEAVRQHAYVPYSSFPVGAAILTTSGTVFVGCNVENASYGLSLCAERSAIAAMVAHGEHTIRALAIVTEGQAPIPPCGMCRQVLAEFARDLPIFLASSSPVEATRRTRLTRLMPDPFKQRQLPDRAVRGGRTKRG